MNKKPLAVIIVVLAIIIIAVVLLSKSNKKAPPLFENTTATSTSVTETPASTNDRSTKEVVITDASLKLVYHSDVSTTTGVTVVIGVYKNDKFIQTLKADADGIGFDSVDFITNLVQIVDANFDGNKDVAVLTCMGATGNSCFTFYLWNTMTNKFELNQALTDTYGWPNEKTKVIEAFWNNGCAGQCYTNQTYKIENNKPVLILKETQDLSLDWKTATKVTTTLKNGTYVTSTTTAPFDINR